MPKKERFSFFGFAPASEAGGEGTFSAAEACLLLSSPRMLPAARAPPSTLALPFVNFGFGLGRPPASTSLSSSRSVESPSSCPGFLGMPRTGVSSCKAVGLSSSSSESANRDLNCLRGACGESSESDAYLDLYRPPVLSDGFAGAGAGAGTGAVVFCLDSLLKTGNLVDGFASFGVSRCVGWAVDGRPSSTDERKGFRFPNSEPEGDIERRLKRFPRPLPSSRGPTDVAVDGRACGDDERIVLGSRAAGAPVPRMLRLMVYRSPSDMTLVGRARSRLKLLSLASESLRNSVGIAEGFDVDFGIACDGFEGAVDGRDAGTAGAEERGMFFFCSAPRGS